MNHEQFVFPIPPEYYPTLKLEIGQKQLEAVIDYEYEGSHIQSESVLVAFRMIDAPFIDAGCLLMAEMYNACMNNLKSQSEQLPDLLHKVMGTRPFDEEKWKEYQENVLK